MRLLTVFLTACGLTAAAPLPAASDFLLDDFEGDSSKIQTSWWTGHDDNGLGTEMQPDPFKPEKGGAPPSPGRAAHVHGFFGANKPPYPWAHLALPLDASGTDLSAYRGVSFWAKGRGRWRLILVKASVMDWADYEFVFNLPDQWTEFEVPFSDFIQPSWGKRVERSFHDVKEIKFAPVDHGKPFEAWIDHFVFRADPESKAEPPFRVVETIAQLPLEEIRAKKIRYTPIPLGRAANRDFRDETEGDGKGGWTDQGKNSVYDFPTGAVTLQGVPFHIQNQKGAQCLVLRGQGHKAYPVRAEIPVGARGAALYFLHAAAWASPTVGTYTVHYADGKTQTIRVRNGVEVFDWWTPASSPVARTAWKGANPLRDPVGLTLFAWANPRPEVEIAKITAETPGDAAFLMVAGITLASEGPYLPRLEPKTYRTQGWFPDPGIDVKQRRGSALDMRFLLDAPAGKHGWLKREGDRFVFEDGAPAAFFGINIVASANFPEKRDAEWMAELLAQLGCNLTRHHHMDARWADRNLFGKGAGTRALDPENLDRFDYLVAQLQKHGIYQYLDLLVHREVTEADGVPHPEDVGPGMKIHGEFVPHLIELQKEFVRQLLTHRNPYTGKTYAEDPAFCLMEIINEDSLFYRSGDEGEWGLKTDHYRGVWRDLFNAWLLDRYGSREKLEARWKPAAGEEGKGLLAGEDPARGTVESVGNWRDGSHRRWSHRRTLDNFYYYFALQMKYFREMEAHVRSLGSKALLTGSNHWVEFPADLYANARLGYVDRHAYWAHPNGGWGYRPDVTFEPSSMLKNSRFGILGDLAYRRVKGYPYTVTEWQTCAPNDYRVEGLPIMAAYGRLQGWNAVVQFSFSHVDSFGKALASNFDIYNQPAQLAAWPLAALMFHRGDVAEANEALFHPLSDAEVLQPETRIEVPPALAAAVKTGVEFTGKVSRRADLEAAARRFEKGAVVASSTGELTWDREKGIFRFETPRTQGFVGFSKSAPQVFPNLEVKPDNAFCLLAASALDGEAPLATASRILLFAAANAINTGQKVRADGNRLQDPGTAPVLVEPVTGTATLKGLHGDLSKARVYPLDPSGARGKPLKIQRGAGSLTFTLEAKHKALHYEIVRGGE